MDRTALTALARPRTRLACALACALLAAALLAATATAAPAAHKKPRKIGRTVATLKFHLDKGDRRALKARQRETKLTAQADRYRAAAALYDQRIQVIETLLADAQGDEQRLQDELASQLVDQYTSGTPNSGGLDFLLGSGSLGDAITRAHAYRAQLDQQEALARSHELSLARLEELRGVLESLRDSRTDQATHLDDRGAALDEVLVANTEGHVESEATMREDAGSPGTWYVVGNGSLMSGLFAAAYNGSFGAAFDGGTRTPRRPATPDEISKILGDPRIEIYPGGIDDIQGGKIDGRVLDALELLADRFGTLHITSLMSGHGYYTSSGNVSEHAFGCAVDIGSVNGIVIQSSTQGPGSITEQAVKFLAGLQGDLAPHQVISLFSYGGPTLALPDHNDHIHLGYAC